MMTMEQSTTMSFPGSFYPSPAWSPPSSETDYSCNSVVSNSSTGNVLTSVGFIKNEPISAAEHLVNCQVNSRPSIPPVVTPSPPPVSSASVLQHQQGYHGQMTGSYAPLTPPYKYEPNVRSSPPHSSYWQTPSTSTPPPYEDFYSDLQDSKYSLTEPVQVPADKAGCLDEFNDEGALEQLRAICLQQAAMDVQLACARLNISPNPCSWSVPDVQRWVMWLVKEKKLDYGSDQMQVFLKVNGMQLVNWCEKLASSQQLHPAHRRMVDAICAHLDIWKSAAQTMQHHQRQLAEMEPCSADTAAALVAPATVFQQSLQTKCLPTNHESTFTTGHSTSPVYNTDDSYSDDDDSSPGSQGCSTQHIHLWQFLKELLSDAQQHGACIRWLDRGRGIFKIEDSVRVAKLWGRRKNRPAMNYDKLSRSIRQYYRKGIMKKTERSQRLVYQFCPAYAN